MVVNRAAVTHSYGALLTRDGGEEVVEERIGHVLKSNHIEDFEIIFTSNTEKIDHKESIISWIRSHNQIKKDKDIDQHLTNFNKKNSYDLILILGSPISTSYFDSFSFYRSEIYFSENADISMIEDQMALFLHRYNNCTKNFGH